MKRLFFLVSLLAIALLVGCLPKPVDLDGKEELEVIDLPATSAMIQVPKQAIEDDLVYVPKVVFDSAGFIVIQAMDKGTLDKIVGYSEVYQKGEYLNVGVVVSEYEGITEFSAVIYYDDGDGVFEVPGADKPISSKGNVIMSTFVVDTEQAK